MKNLIKKNLLDLAYQKNLQFFNTSVLSWLSYAVSVIVYLCLQNFQVPRKIFFILVSASILFTAVAAFFVVYSYSRMEAVSYQISKLD